MSQKDQDARPVGSLDDLLSVFVQSGKPASEWKLGIEQEKVGAFLDGGIVPFSGERGIEGVLRVLQKGGYEGHPLDAGGPILELSRDGERITLEPGGQLEHSGATLPTAVACAEAL